MKKYCLVYGCCVIDKAKYMATDKSSESFGGKGGNQAVALSRAGVNTVLLSVLSSAKEEKKDTKRHLKNLKKNKINTKYLGYNDKFKNDVTFVTVDKNGNNSFKEEISMSSNFSVEYIRKNEEVIKNASIVLLQMKVPIETTREIIKICKKNGVKTILTPCRIEKTKANADILEDIDFITCNENEARMIFTNSSKLKMSELDDVLKKYPNKLIVTLGGKGVRFFDGKKIVFEKSLKVDNVLDTTGAGDTFAGNLAEAIFNGKSLQEAVRRGICASTIKIQTIGTQTGMPYKKQRDLLYNKTYGGTNL